MKDPLSITHPQLAGQWHPTNNGEISPDIVKKGSKKKLGGNAVMGPITNGKLLLRKESEGADVPFVLVKEYRLLIP